MDFLIEMAPGASQFLAGLNAPSKNPNGIPSQSPGLSRKAGSHPGHRPQPFPTATRLRPFRARGPVTSATTPLALFHGESERGRLARVFPGLAHAGEPPALLLQRFPLGLNRQTPAQN